MVVSCAVCRAGVNSKRYGIDQFNSILELEQELELKDLEQNELELKDIELIRNWD